MVSFIRSNIAVFEGSDYLVNAKYIKPIKSKIIINTRTSHFRFTFLSNLNPLKILRMIDCTKEEFP